MITDKKTRRGIVHMVPLQEVGRTAERLGTSVPIPEDEVVACPETHFVHFRFDWSSKIGDDRRLSARLPRPRSWLEDEWRHPSASGTPRSRPFSPTGPHETRGLRSLWGDDTSLTYAQVEDQAEALAASLAHLGIEAGERIATVLPSWPEFAVTVFAAAKLGAVVVPLDPRLPRIELRYMLRHSGATCAVTAEDAFGTDYLQLFEDLLEELPELGYVVTVGEEDLWYDDQIFQWEDLLSAGAGRDFAAGRTDPEDTFAIVYTAGTTGKPKGVELTHRNLLQAAAATAGAIDLGPGDVVVGVRALFHVFGLGPGLLGTLLGGAGLVLADGADATETLDLADRHGATVHYGIPSMFARELREIERRGRRPESIRACLVSGAAMKDELARRIEESFGAPVVAAYSLTEGASTLAGRPPGRPARTSGSSHWADPSPTRPCG